MATAQHDAIRPRDDTGLTTLVSQLATDAREVASAEIALQKARVFEKVTRYKGAAIYLAAAALLAFAALIALLVGLIATLTPRVGPGFATVIVIGVTFAIVGILAAVGKSRLGGSGVAA